MTALTITATILQISPSKFHQIPYYQAEVNPEIESKEIGGWRPSTHTFLCNVIIILALVKYGKTMPCSTLDDFRLLCLILLKDDILIYFGLQFGY